MKHTARHVERPPATNVSATMSQFRRDFELEAWIARELRVPDLFLGHTTREIRRDRLVALLEERKLMDSHAGKVQGKPRTWREIVTRLYGDQAVSMTLFND